MWVPDDCTMYIHSILKRTKCIIYAGANQVQSPPVKIPTQKLYECCLILKKRRLIDEHVGKIYFNSFSITTSYPYYIIYLKNSDKFTNQLRSSLTVTAMCDPTPQVKPNMESLAVICCMCQSSQCIGYLTSLQFCTIKLSRKELKRKLKLNYFEMHLSF